ARRVWPALGRRTELFRNPSDAGRRFVPVRLDETAAPPGLEAFGFVALQRDEDFARLGALCSPPAEEGRGGTILRCVAALHGHTDGMTHVAVTPDGRRAVSASGDWTLRVWDLDGYAPLAALQGHTGPVYDVAVTPDGRRAVSASLDRTVRVW